ncbi:hydrolase (plasmid) [Fulvitalea axinellae]|uniref:Hydrolase n=1 Tax=Fulvitalea axinellae TaxID=1182444 RepID=A0AAU9DE80_9BACT|nr:hydrolase [Fulvitalea axinellae]
MMEKSVGIVFYKKQPRKALLYWAFWLCLLNGLVMTLIGTRFAEHMGTLDTGWAWLYVALTTAGHFSVMAFLPFLLVSLPVTLVLPKKWLVISLTVLATVFVDAVLLADAAIFAQYRYHINGFVLGLLFGGAAGDIFQFSAMSYVLAIGGILGALVAVFIVAEVFWRLALYRRLRFGGVLFGLLLSFMVASHLMHAVADASYYRPITKVARFFPLYYPLTASKDLYKWGIVDQEEARKNASDVGVGLASTDLVYPKKDLAFGASADSLNVLLISIDSWRYDMLDSAIMPNLSAFADSAVVFDKHYSGSNGTRGGIFSLFYGLPSLYWNAMKSTGTEAILMSEIRKRGYEAGIFTSAALTSPAFDKTVFAGFDSLRLRTENAEPNVVWGRDRQITREWKEFTAERAGTKGKKPFFGFLFYDGPHGYSHPEGEQPFLPAWKEPNYLALDNDTDPEPFFNLYKNTVHYDDKLLGQVFADLENKGLADNTIVIITGDHGQEFNDNKQNYWGHGSNFTDAQIRVPLIVKWPGRAPQKISRMTTHYDVVPTLMARWLGCENLASDYAFGKDLFGRASRNWLISGSYDNFGVVEDDRITVTFPTGNYEIYDRDMNELNENIRAETINAALGEVNTFYRK